MASRAVDQSLLLFIFLVLECLFGISEAGKGRIVGGSNTYISEAKYTVQLFLNGEFQCGGSLITSTHVLTAAHCVVNHDEKEFEVVGGSTYRNGVGAVTRRVGLILYPTAYNRPWSHLDVAVMFLCAPLTGSNIQTIKLCSKPIPVGHRVKVYGWGRIRNNGMGSYQLRSIEMPVVSKPVCQRTHRAKITDSMLCAGVPGRPVGYANSGYDRNPKSTCHGDSGGPLVYKNEVCGIVSFGNSCASWPASNVYTDVYKVREVIVNAMASHYKLSCPVVSRQPNFPYWHN